MDDAQCFILDLSQARCKMSDDDNLTSCAHKKNVCGKVFCVHLLWHEARSLVASYVARYATAAEAKRLSGHVAEMECLRLMSERILETSFTKRKVADSTASKAVFEVLHVSREKTLIKMQEPMTDNEFEMAQSAISWSR